MKKILFILMAIFVTTFTSYAQITTMSAFEKKVEKVAYDVTKNFLGTENVESYVGQVLYVNGIDERLQGYGYDNFKTKKVRHYDSDNRYGNPSVKSSYYTKYEDLFGKYFKVLNVDKSETGEEYYVFTLQNRDNENDIVYFNYNGKYEDTFPFIVVSHFEWCKNNLIGKKYFLTYFSRDDKIYGRYTSDTDFVNGENIIYNTNDVWECVDVTVESKMYDFVMLLKNKNGNVITYKIKYIDNNEDGEVNILTEKAYHNLVTKYGVTMVNAMRKHFIKIGMNKDLLIMSWGKPDEINSNTYGADQWVYGTQYVYVKNGKIEGWN